MSIRCSVSCFLFFMLSLIGAATSLGAEAISKANLLIFLYACCALVDVLLSAIDNFFRQGPPICLTVLGKGGKLLKIVMTLYQFLRDLSRINNTELKL